MNRKVKAKWLEALRSGDYEQGTSALRSCDDKFCILGVLVDIYDGREWESTDYDYVVRYKGCKSAFALPSSMEKELELTEEEIEELIDLNDIECQTFEQIAEYIEENI